MGRFFMAPLAKMQKSGFVATHAFAIHKFRGVIEENRLRNKKVYAFTGGGIGGLS